MMKKAIGVLAHVDAGKTTFSEQILLNAGVLRRAGRVDHKDSFMDHNPIERERGITVFSDQAIFDFEGDRYYWIDTPGHTDLCAEMERTLPVLDYAILIVSCSEGVESHTETVWELLKKHNIPALIFINKCDRPDADREACLRELRTRLCADICDFTGYTQNSLPENIAECIAERNDALLEIYLSGEADTQRLKEAAVHELKKRQIFPVFFGSALKGEGIREFLEALSALTAVNYDCDADFSAKAFKVRYDEHNARRLYLRVLSGRLAIRDTVNTSSGAVQIGELSVCHGGKYLPVKNCEAGDIVCVSGLRDVRIGDGLGTLAGTKTRFDTVPLLETAVIPEKGFPNVKLLEILRILEDEDPTLSVRCGRNGEICIRVMGIIENEIIRRVVSDRFGIQIEFGKPQVVFMETVQESGVGIGHYEPLKHYAEVWLRISPNTRGAGITFESKCHVDRLALNWQRLIETHVFERAYPGVLIGAPLTDVKIELLAGRAHPKHTEGGDFREATCRAIRCALMNAVNLLLEPMVRVKLCFSEDLYGRVLGDLHDMNAEKEEHEVRSDGNVTITAVCTLRNFMDYPVTFRALSHGRGTLFVSNAGYAPALNPRALVDAFDYDPRGEDTPDSVFCSHGAGHLVRWDAAPSAAHCIEEAYAALNN